MRQFHSAALAIAAKAAGQNTRRFSEKPPADRFASRTLSSPPRILATHLWGVCLFPNCPQRPRPLQRPEARIHTKRAPVRCFYGERRHAKKTGQIGETLMRRTSQSAGTIDRSPRHPGSAVAPRRSRPSRQQSLDDLAIRPLGQ
jgi:hypothetical protein